MKPLIGIIVVVLLGIGEQAIAETDAKRRAELERIIEKLREEAQERKVVLVDKGPGWSRYIFDGQELVIDGDHRKDTVYAFDLSDQLPSTESLHLCERFAVMGSHVTS